MERVTYVQRNSMNIASLTLLFLACLQDATQVSYEGIFHLRNCLMAEILLRGAPRSGVMTNATIGEFQQRQILDDEKFEDIYIMKVSLCMG